MTHELTLASITLGVATTSALVYPPAQVVCLPLLLYLGINPAQTAYRTWREEGRVTLALAETTVLAVCIVRHYYLIGTLSCWAYALGQRREHVRQAQFAAQRVVWQPPTWAWLQRAGEECATPVQSLHAGDIIVVHMGEMVPVAGVVMAGVAWLKAAGGPLAASSSNDAVGQPDTKVIAGCNVEAATIVQVGRIWVAVSGEGESMISLCDSRRALRRN